MDIKCENKTKQKTIWMKTWLLATENMQGYGKGSERATKHGGCPMLLLTTKA